MESDPTFPRMVRVHQRLYDRILIDLDSEVIRQVESRLRGRVSAGQHIAIAVGSRGIANIARIVRGTVEAVRRLGAEPFVVPAMGSHGGATAEGQIEVLASLGITEAFIRCPIRSSMDVVQIGTTDDGLPVFLDRNAASADGIIVVNRVKKHTDFRGDVESGLLKMICIGLGKRVQAELIHSYGAADGLRHYIPLVARVTLARAPILLGVATLENGYEQTSEIVTLLPEELEAGEKRLLRKNKRTYPSLPIDKFDILVVDRLGKEVSGTGMDTNVIGRYRVAGIPEPSRPRIRTVVALSLTEASHGNAVGVGLADYISRRLADAIDHESMSINVITSGFLERGKLPVTLGSDHLAVSTALSRLPPESRRRPRLVRLLDTLHLSEFDVSEALVDELRGNSRITLIGEPEPMRFDAAGTIAPMIVGEPTSSGTPVPASAHGG